LNDRRVHCHSHIHTQPHTPITLRAATSTQSCCYLAIRLFMACFIALCDVGNDSAQTFV